MLRLDKTITRETTLHADQDAEDWVRWQETPFSEKREVVEHLRHQVGVLHALREVGHQQDRNRNAADLTNGKTST